MTESFTTSISKWPKTLVCVGWIAFIVGQLLPGQCLARLALLMVARGLPQSLTVR